MPRAHVKAYAKVNLFLEITGKRPDGYHTLSTLFQTVSLADDLTFQDAKRLAFSCSDPRLPADEGNLAFKTARLLADSLPESSGVSVHLEKNIPMGAGLGGGSSDAAAVLRTLTKRWKMRETNGALHTLARQLGADVPFFLKGGTTAATGIGDHLKPLPPLPATWFLLVYPGFGISTKEAYSKVRGPFTQRKSMTRMIPLLKRRDPKAWAGHLFNRFEEFVFPDYPELPKVKHALLQAGAIGALMSGSGSTVFGVMRNAAHGRRTLAHIRKAYPQSWLVHTI